ncbi:hypothetical protein [Sphingomonas sp. VNH70]|uniref:hypothetical protein n=1 Tax=Sphingomonas silueang TaxID=3156617 RepID=UPI0032B5087E
MSDTSAGPRCPICGNPGWHDRAWPECTHCGLAVERLDFDADELRAAIRHMLERAPTTGHPFVPSAVEGRAAGAAHGVSTALDTNGGEQGFALAPHARRNAAWALGLVADGSGWRPARPRSHAVTLGIIARASELAQVAAMLGALRPHFPRAIVLLDGTMHDAATLAMQARGVQVAAHPLDGDFAAQRNRVQAMADGWVLQLDTDERPEPELVAALGWLTAAADADGLVSLGLPRRNLVDGQVSALWPDIQYRLNRAGVRFAGRVHERPVVPFAATSLALPGAIEHRLDRARVLERSRVYEAMSAGAGRPGDEAALLRPFSAAT